MNIPYTVIFKDGTSASLFVSGHHFPPDYKGPAPASASLWVRYGLRWWRPVKVSIHKVVADLEACDSWEEVLLFDIVDPEPWGHPAEEGL